MYTVYESFMAKKIISGSKTYTSVVTARPDLKTGIDSYLIEIGHQYLITEV